MRNLWAKAQINWKKKDLRVKFGVDDNRKWGRSTPRLVLERAASRLSEGRGKKTVNVKRTIGPDKARGKRAPTAEKRKRPNRRSTGFVHL